MLLETRPNLKIYIDLKLHRWFHQNKIQKKKETRWLVTRLLIMFIDNLKKKQSGTESHTESQCKKFKKV